MLASQVRINAWLALIVCLVLQMHDGLKLVWCMTPLTSQLMGRRNYYKEVNLICRTFVDSEWLVKLKVFIGDRTWDPWHPKRTLYHSVILSHEQGTELWMLDLQNLWKTITVRPAVLKIWIRRLLGVFWAFFGHFPQVWEWNEFLKWFARHWIKHYWSNMLGRNFFTDAWFYLIRLTH